MRTNKNLADAFWAEMSPCEHFVQIYEAEEAFVDTLAGFVGGGLLAGQAAVVIMTPAHRVALDQRLAVMGIDLDHARSRDQYLSLDAQETLSKFIVDDWPDDARFAEVISEILERARDGNRRKVRAFGEMVALLWAQGATGATVRLEYLWHELCQKESFCLFCAYPKIGFTENPLESIARVCEAHTKVLAA